MDKHFRQQGFSCWLPNHHMPNHHGYNTNMFPVKFNFKMPKFEGAFHPPFPLLPTKTLELTAPPDPNLFLVQPK